MTKRHYIYTNVRKAQQGRYVYGHSEELENRDRQKKMRRLYYAGMET
jgi:hypothetical protein